MANLKVRRIAYALGADVTGIDVRESLDSPTVAAIREAWLEHLVLRFPDQYPDKDDLARFARCFGELEIVRDENKPEVTTPNIHFLSNKPVNGEVRDPAYRDGQRWHTDESYTTHPTSAAFISAKEIPQAGGDTIWANGYMAYETLSPAMQNLIEPLSAVHEVPARRRHLPGNDPTAQPLVRVHPETGRKALYVGYRASKFVGMTEEESRPILDFLNAHAVRYEFTYRHRWTANDLIMWDNRCTHHIAVADYDLRHDVRHMLRTAVIGETSGVALAASAS